MRFVDPMKDTAEGKLLAIVRDIEKAVGIKKDEGRTHKLGGIRQGPQGQIDSEGVCADDCWCKTETIKAEKNSTYNYECNMGCEEGSACEQCYPKPKGTKGVKKEDHTHQFIRKYVQESSGDNVKPMFMEISGKTEIPAAGYQGNQVLPYSEDASESKAISEVFKMPSVAQTGYDKDSSSLHMHFNDGGDYDYRAKVEESLAEIKKQATVGQQGVVEEIAGLIESIYARL